MEGGNRLSETVENLSSPFSLYPKCGVAVTSRVPRRLSEKIFVLHSCTASSVSRHETWITYGAVRIEESVTAKHTEPRRSTASGRSGKRSGPIDWYQRVSDVD